MKVNYTFSKDPINSTIFDIVRTKHSSDEFRTVILKESEDSKSEKFKDLQKDDVLILKEDLINKEQDNIVAVESVTYIDSGLYEVTLKAFSKAIYGIDEYDDEEDQLVVLARVNKSDAQIPE